MEWRVGKDNGATTSVVTLIKEFIKKYGITSTIHRPSLCPWFVLLCGRNNTAGLVLKHTPYHIGVIAEYLEEGRCSHFVQGKMNQEAKWRSWIVKPGIILEYLQLKHVGRGRWEEKPALDSLLLPCGTLALNSDSLAWRQDLHLCGKSLPSC